jgi:hypothetical protein
MKIKTSLISILLVFFALPIFLSCTQPVSELEDPIKIENTLKSVSLLNDSIPIDPAELLASLKRINAAIDSIGYPDAGYKLWQLKSDSILNFRFMVEGHWPDQNGYDAIHDHELYKTAFEAEDQIWEGVERTWYNRFTKVVLE